ncbi:MAG TPA: sensor histidine kinase [Fulvivirga sp.]|nr:sensor histidine kinase [Fulvivirga sp.]
MNALKLLIGSFLLSCFINIPLKAQKESHLRTVNDQNGNFDIAGLWLIARENKADSAKTKELIKRVEVLTWSEENQRNTLMIYLTANLESIRGNFDSAINKYGKLADTFRDNNDSSNEALILLDLSTLLSKSGNYESAIKHSFDAMHSFLAIKDSFNLISTYSNIGRSYQLSGNLDSALVYLYKSIDIIESYKPKNSQEASYLRLAGNTYNNTGISYMENGELDKAYNFYQKAMSKKMQIKDTIEIGNMYINFGGLMFTKNDLSAARSYLDSAAEYYTRKNYIQGILLCKTNSAAVSIELKEYNSAINYALEGLSIAKKNSDLYHTSLNYFHIGTANGHKQLSSAFYAYLDSALTVAKQIDSKNLIAENYNARYAFALKNSAYKEALDYRNEYFAVRDAMFQAKRSSEISNLETKYKTKEKESEISFLNQQNALKEASLQRNTLLIFGLITLLILVVVIFYFLRYRFKQNHKAVLDAQKIRMRESQMQAVIDSQENERKRFAEDLHDGMGQLVAALQLNIKSLQSDDKNIEQRAEIVDHSTELLKEVHQEIRNIAFNLMPQTLVKEGLNAALSELIYKINKTDQMAIHYSSLDVPNSLDEIVEVSLYRITQELLSNILKHGNAKNIYLDLTGHDDELVLSIEDDGTGFDIDLFKNSAGNGWRNISTRISLIKGEINIENVINVKGNSVIINVPLVVKNTRIGILN